MQVLKLIVAALLIGATVTEAGVRIPFGQSSQDLGSSRISLDEYNSTELKEWNEGPRGFAINGNEFVFLDSFKQRLAVYDAEGKFLRSVALPGVVDELAVEPSMVFCEGTEFYVWDDAQSRLLKSMEGNWKAVSLEGLGPVVVEQMIQSNGGILMVDSFSGKVIRLVSSGEGKMKAEPVFDEDGTVPQCNANGQCVSLKVEGNRFLISRKGEGAAASFSFEDEAMGARILHSDSEIVVVELVSEDAGFSGSKIKVFQWDGKVAQETATARPLPNWDMRPAAVRSQEKLLIPLHDAKDSGAIELWVWDLSPR
ncbi:MAG: hypothetical protein H3C47_04410 [Candidatus Cloacimonetes bacterium]|nr:hypothetical protein [Candidatus Cloacimonadota bacterium]